MGFTLGIFYGFKYFSVISMVTWWDEGSLCSITAMVSDAWSNRDMHSEYLTNCHRSTAWSLPAVVFQTYLSHINAVLTSYVWEVKCNQLGFRILCFRVAIELNSDTSKIELKSILHIAVKIKHIFRCHRISV